MTASVRAFWKYVLATAAVLMGLAAAMLARSAQDSRSPLEAIAELEGTVALLRQQVIRLHDVAAIENLISAYGYYLDKQHWDHVADLFAEDGTMEISLRGVYIGKKSIRRALELFGPRNIRRGHLHNHVQIQPVITVAPDGRTAWVRSRAFSQLGTFGGRGLWGDGIYENELVKEDGVWKIKKDHIYTTFFAPYESGWAQVRPSAPGPSETIPPDRPSSALYEPYPGFHVPPFHYRHPVTGARIPYGRN